MIHTYQATVEDIPVIQHIAYHTWPIAFEKILTLDQLTYMLDMMYSSTALTEQIEQKGHVFLLSGFKDHTPLGFASFEINYQNLPVTKIHKIYIMPEAQGKGLGKNLFDRIAEESIAQKINKLSLNVNRKNRKALEFYLRTGFVFKGEENIPIGRGYLMEDFILEKNLS